MSCLRATEKISIVQANKQTNKMYIGCFFSPKPVLTQVFKSVTPLDAMSPSN